uniref:Uncharacterized protein n=1 Tax=Aegilops tauschii TaxID=37682 RepID=R7W6K2_AEGTA
MASSLRVFCAGGVTALPAPSRSTNACAAPFLVGRRSSSSTHQASAALTPCRARPSTSDLRSWWAAELTPEDISFDDFPEPTTGRGQEELRAIWKALVTDPLQPVLLAMREMSLLNQNIEVIGQTIVHPRNIIRDEFRINNTNK